MTENSGDFEGCYLVGNGLSQFIRRAEDKSNYFIGDRPGYVEACMVPFAWHTHLAKGRGKPPSRTFWTSDPVEVS